MGGCFFATKKRSPQMRFFSPAMASQIHRPKIPAVILCLRSPDQFGAAGLFAHLSNSVSGLIWLFA